MKHYLLEQDLLMPDIAGIGGVPEDIEPLDWIQGKKLPPPRPDLQLTLSNTSGDYWGDIIGSLVTVFSDDLKEILTRLGVDNIDYFPVELLDPRTMEIGEGFWLVNVLGRVACVDAARSTIIKRPYAGVKLRGFAVDAKRAQGLKLFRLDEDPTLIVITEELKEALEKEQLSGVRMRETTEYDGF